jgi:hypothetical protein
MINDVPNGGGSNKVTVAKPSAYSRKDCLLSAYNTPEGTTGIGAAPLNNQTKANAIQQENKEVSGGGGWREIGPQRLLWITPPPRWCGAKNIGR